MPRRNNRSKRSSRKYGGLSIRPFEDQIQTSETSTFGTPFIINYNCQELLPTLTRTNPRFCRLRHARIQFTPFQTFISASPTLVANTGATVTVAMIDSATKVTVPLIMGRALSNVNPTTVRFRVPAEFARFYQSNNDQEVVLQITVHTSAGLASEDFTMAITLATSWDLALAQVSVLN